MIRIAAVIALGLAVGWGPGASAAEPEGAPEPGAETEPAAEPEAEAEAEAESAAETEPAAETETESAAETETERAPQPDPGPTPTPPSGVAAKKKDDGKGLIHPFGLTLLLSNSVGMGTFGGGDYNHRPYWNLTVSVRPKWTFHEELKLSLSARLDLSVDLVENADSASTRRQQLFLSDTRLKVAWADALVVKPAFLAWSTAFELLLPTSPLSDLTGKYLGLRLALATAFEPLEWLSFTWTVAATKNFNAYTTATLDHDDFDRPPLARAGDGADVATGLTATGLGITEWGLSNSLTLELSFLERFAFTLDWTLVHAWTYQRFPVDGLSSPYAQPSRGLSDSMVGSLELSVEVLDTLSVGVGTLVEQTPKTLDNERLRFPFWDTTNGAANRQVFYVDVTGTL